MNLTKISIAVMTTALCLSTAACTTQKTTQIAISQQVQSALNLDETSLMNHLRVLQKIADEHSGNRAVGTKGGQASAQYIVEQAKKAGLAAQMLPFENRNKKVGQNVMVEIQGKSKETAIILGAHYDSVPMGPGINDNGSGVAVLLELMHHYANTQPKHTLYFAFWDSEEDGIGGSTHFVSKLTDTQLQGIQAYINVDMVGTKHANIQIADGDRSSIAEMEAMLKANGMDEAEYKPLTDGLRNLPRHAADVALENHLKAFFTSQGLEIKEDVSALTASDTLPFLGKVPVTSIILFNEQMKGSELEFAPCYHKACDRLDLIDPASLQLTKNALKDLIGRIESNTP